MAGSNFVAAYPDGSRRIFAHVGNPASFRKAMASAGVRIEEADDSHFRQAGYEDGSRAFNAISSLQLVPLPDAPPAGAAARPTATTNSLYDAGCPGPAAPEPAKPLRFDLAASMRKQFGLQTPEELEAEKANRGTLARMMDDVVARKTGQTQTQARR
ncbi:hypothetical protein [Antarcticirhabdus aurantiaca]|uniref:Uncharacterized protein n=1 Tax=Antarcticirhabdus aurantiaca TaxID=2606717 RepID=A0ACD4NUU0_9HYPH|nr:hypothetical protein [Antarcticirhabdus aurantiaca]WAJ30614.1 hypothetical protein OXU80_10580 [Jeongeuplla avenae]